MSTLPVDEHSSQADLLGAVNRIVWRDHGNINFGEPVIWRYTGSSYVLELENASGNLLNAGGVFTVQTSLVHVIGAVPTILGGTLEVVGNTTLDGTLHGIGAVTFDSTLHGIGAVTLDSSLTVKGNTALGDANTDTLTVIGLSTYRNAANSAIQLFVDAGNNRVIVGTATPLGTAPNDLFSVIGNTSYFAGNPAIGIRFGASETVGWTVGSSATGANSDLLFKDDGSLETFRVGDTSSTYQAIVTGKLNVTGALSAGSLSISTAPLVLTGGQIQFPAVQNPSADANTLDDYEEGPWTPALGGSATYTVNAGRYTKVGRLVAFSGNITVNAIGTGSTTVISGLPFAAADNLATVNVGYFGSSVTNILYLSGYINNAGTTINLVSTTAAQATMAANAIFQNATQIAFSGTYSV